MIRAYPHDAPIHAQKHCAPPPPPPLSRWSDITIKSNVTLAVSGHPEVPCCLGWTHRQLRPRSNLFYLGNIKFNFQDIKWLQICLLLQIEVVIKNEKGDVEAALLPWTQSHADIRQNKVISRLNKLVLGNIFPAAPHFHLLLADV